MRFIVGILLIVTVLTGCKSSFKSNFTNFNAYYNTFYNAKKSYNLGVSKSDAQPRIYNSLQPLRIYQTPLGAGNSDFQNAIDKGADILRKYDDSKWVDNALEIIGKSYFYKSEYFSADQKFDELFLSTDDVELKQKAIFWKGRVLLELQLYTKGIQYLSDQLSSNEQEWQGDLEYEVRVLLAEHYVERENWVNALDQLNIAVKQLPKKAYKERGYFLIGQLNEILGNNEDAYDAYDKVTKNYVEYNLQFEAQKKKAEVARALGRSDDAVKVFSSMVKDDKNAEFIADLNFELGKTEQDRGNYKKAESIYKSILKDTRVKPRAATKAKVYNGLAEIYRFNYVDYKLAAAYYDSSASLKVSDYQLPDGFNPGEYAKSFGKYSELKNEIHLKDSLLWLGNLPKAEFDSVIAVLEQKKRDEIAQLQKEQEAQKNTLVNVNTSDNQSNSEANLERNGFLSYKNPVMLADASQQFRALWEGRALTNNWRVAALMINEVKEQVQSNGDANNDNAVESTTIFMGINLEQIPFTPQDQDSVKEEISSLNYQLANLFFLSLDLADSAEFYFNRVIRERPKSKVAPVSLYSLSELSLLKNDEKEAKIRAQILVDTYPTTVYADRLIDKFGLERPALNDTAEVSPKNRFLNILNNSTLNTLEKANKFKEFEEKNRKTDLGGKALVEVVNSYITLAKQDSNYIKKSKYWSDLNSNWESEKRQFKVKQDSAIILMEDSVLSVSDSLYYVSILDSTLTEPDLIDAFPYRGEFWDSTRTSIDEFLANYPKSEQKVSISILKKEFEVPIEPVAEVEEEIISEDNVVESNRDSEEYISCEEIDQEVFIRGGKDRFLNRVEIPSNRQVTEISFLFFINIRGIIDEFKLSSDTEDEALINAFVSSIDEDLSFDPVLVNGKATAISCNITFNF